MVMKINHQKTVAPVTPLKFVHYSVALTNECHVYYSEI
jgi:hypothetical protein